MKRFWEKVRKGPGCWLWVSAKKSSGYGAFRFNGRARRANRVSWEIANGPIPPGLCVLHRCDVRACVRPSHLFLGTVKDNSDDMVAKGRNRHVSVITGIRNRGEMANFAKLTESKVREIRSIYGPATGKGQNGPVSQKKIAIIFGVSQGAISAIVTRLTWKHI